jgi:hypothetical protein
MDISPRTVRCTTLLLDEMRNACKILVRTPEIKGLLGSPWQICENNIKMNHKVKGLESIGWIKLSKDSWVVAGSCKHG